MFSTIVPAKLLILIELILINTRSRAKINNKYAEKFKVESGVKQADPPSATLYSVVVVVIFKQLDLRGNISKASNSLEVCHPRCVMSNITVYNMYVLTHTCSQKHNN